MGDVGDGGRLRCPHSKADTTISCVYGVHVLLALPSVLGVWSMALALRKIYESSPIHSVGERPILTILFLRGDGLTCDSLVW